MVSKKAIVELVISTVLAALIIWLAVSGRTAIQNANRVPGLEKKLSAGHSNRGQVIGDK